MLGMGRQGAKEFLRLKCVKIWNKIPYHYGNWKYPEIKNTVCKERKRIQVGTFFTVRLAFEGNN